MRHRLLGLCVAACWLSVACAFGQITITAGNIPGPGTVLEGREVYGEFVTVGPSGANQQWVLPDYMWMEMDEIEFVDPDNTPFADDFPNATRAMRTGGEYEGHEGWNYLFQRISQSALWEQGMAFQADTFSFLMPYQDESMRAPLPLTYGSSWTSVAKWVFEPLPGFPFINTDSSIITMDGWGTLTTDFGTKQVLRAFGHTWEIVDPPIGQTTTTEYVYYSWVDQRCVIVCDMTPSEPTTNPNFTTADVTLLGWDFVGVEPARGPVARKLGVGQNYPNPFNPRTTVSLDLARATHVTFEIYDETGRLLFSESMELGAGRHDLPVNGSAWATGNYFARVSAGDERQTVKMQLVR